MEYGCIVLSVHNTQLSVWQTHPIMFYEVVIIYEQFGQSGDIASWESVQAARKTFAKGSDFQFTPQNKESEI